MADKHLAGADAIVMDPKDHVATALADLQAGQGITYRIKSDTFALVLGEAIPFGHKVAITRIAQGEHVRKYGEVIGSATVDIEPGKHVHVHNIEGIRGRGDQAQKQAVSG